MMMMMMMMMMTMMMSSPLKRLGMDHSFYTANTPCVHQAAPPLTSDSSHLIADYYSFIDPKRKKG